MTSDSNKYGIVIDSGSSGSRIQIYRWEDPNKLKNDHQDQDQSQDSSTILTSPPVIIQKSQWSKKTSPGISSFKDKVGQAWNDHYSELMKFAEAIIPTEKHHETPVFVLATAGMRMLEASKQDELVSEICSSLQRKTKFYIPNCQHFVQIIDGETEGLYGWLGLNYLMGKFNNYQLINEHESIGFMDMGGASTQIAFVPSSDQIEKHQDDLSTIILRNINGQPQEWKVFVETWLGFGANQARQRYLDQLVNLSLINLKITEVNDPCLPKGAELNHVLDGKTYNIKGIGNYEVCLKTIYPLLLKHIPCKDEPCLFNGIHGPKLDFEKDKFIGISEYWYTANDIFESGGEYNYHTFNEKVRQYCESEWNQIINNYNNGHYSKLDPDKYLKSACFKASWVINILHDGFDLPRLGIEVKETEDAKLENLDDVHIPFKSANSINGDELSWTLGKILLFASSQITSADDNGLEVGLYPSQLSGKPFVPGGGIHIQNEEFKKKSKDSNNAVFSIIFIFLLAYFIYHFSRKVTFKIRRFHTPRFILSMGSKIPYINKYCRLDAPYHLYQVQDSINIGLEEGFMPAQTNGPERPNSSFLRTRLSINLADDNTENEINQSPFNGRINNNFSNKPFPKRNGTHLFSQFSANSSRESLNRVPSNVSLNKQQ